MSDVTVSQVDGRVVLDMTYGDSITRVLLHPEQWAEYRKKVLTRAFRMKEPFTVQTSEGPLTCQDGYLAVDARGYPYPIAADEFELIYEEASSLTS